MPDARRIFHKRDFVRKFANIYELERFPALSEKHQRLTRSEIFIADLHSAKKYLWA